MLHSSLLLVLTFISAERYTVHIHGHHSTQYTSIINMVVQPFIQTPQGNVVPGRFYSWREIALLCLSTPYYCR